MNRVLTLNFFKTMSATMYTIEAIIIFVLVCLLLDVVRLTFRLPPYI